MLDLINADRAKFGRPPVRLGMNAAAQQHAEDMLNNFYIGHVDSGGMKPYMRYSLAGGLGAMGENAAYAGTEDPNDTRLYAPIVPRERLAQLQYAMMYDDADSNWGHRDQILEPQHQVVNIGIAFTQTRLALIQHFEENYVTFTHAPILANGVLTLGGTVDAMLGALRSVDIYYDPTPRAYTHAQLLAQPHSYSVGTSTRPAIQVILPAPPGSFYPSLPTYVSVAESWTGTGTSFQISANIASRITQPGVYTLLLWSANADYPLTTIALFAG
ncbi:MAG: hypothetical protein FJ039_06640 [Chloroflexi bacterium]|nr:hypothetical protein [Chloroflexota bacterium]